MLNIGDMMKKVRNSVKFSIIWFGGVEGVFNVLCNKLSIIMMWVKLVIISNVVGRKFSVVIKISVCIGKD